MRPVDIAPADLETVRRILYEHVPGLEVRAFGSRVLWTARATSDLDLALMTAEPLNIARMAALKAAFTDSSLPFRVDIMDWASTSGSFREVIEKNHMVLVEGREPFDGRNAGMASEWRECEFTAFCDIRRGASPRPIHEWISKEGIPWIKISDASAAGSRFIQHTKERIRPDGSSKSVSVFPGDLILSNSATPGIPKFVGIEACIHDGWLLLRDFRRIDKLFCYYLLQVERPRILRQGSGTVFTNLKTEILKRHRVKIPPLPEQRAIAHILGTLDDKIEINSRMNETLEAMARALFKSWFVDFGPVRAKMTGRWHPDEPLPGLPAHLYDLFPDRLVASELGEIPEGWEVKTLGDCFNLTMGQSPPGSTYNDDSDGLPFFQGRTDFGFRYPENRKFCTAPTRIAEPNDTLVSVRAPVGDVNMAWERCCIGRGLAALRHKSGSSSFTYHSARAIQQELQQYEHTGTVFGAINKKQFQALTTIEPTSEIVDAFGSLTLPLDGRVRSDIAASRTLAALRDTLLPKLVSGQLRVTPLNSDVYSIGTQAQWGPK